MCFVAELVAFKFTVTEALILDGSHNRRDKTDLQRQEKQGTWVCCI